MEQVKKTKVDNVGNFVKMVNSYHCEPTAEKEYIKELDGFHTNIKSEDYPDVILSLRNFHIDGYDKKQLCCYVNLSCIWEKYVFNIFYRDYMYMARSLSLPEDIGILKWKASEAHQSYVKNYPSKLYKYIDEAKQI